MLDLKSQRLLKTLTDQQLIAVALQCVMNMIFMSKTNYIGLTLVLKNVVWWSRRIKAVSVVQTHTDKVDTQHNL